MRTQIQLLASTVVVTLIIWIYADRSGYETRDFNLLNIRLTVPTTTGNQYVVRVPGRPDEAEDALQAEFILSGPKSEIAKLQQEYDSHPFDLQVPLTEELHPGRQTLNLFDLLRDHREIRRRGLTLQSITPKTVEVEIDRYRDVPVEVVLTAGGFEKVLKANPTAEPGKVTARILESRLGQAAPPRTLQVSIAEQIKEQRERGRGLDDEMLSFMVPLSSSWPGLDALFVPEQIRVTVQLEQKTVPQRLTIRPLGMLIKVPDFEKRYAFEWKDKTGADLTQVIEVNIPIEKAGQLNPQQINAYVEINEDMLPVAAGVTATAPAAAEPRLLEGKVRFHFPSGFEDVAIFKQQQETVAFYIIPKPAPEPSLSP